MLCGLLFVLYAGVQWEFLPQELGFGSGMTCRRRLAAWHRAGVWQQLHTDSAGIPLAILLTGGNGHGITQLLALVNSIPPVRG